MIHVVVPNWNGAEHIDACVLSLAAQQGVELTIVVVDNGSVDDSLVILQRLAAQIAPTPLVVLVNERNLGFAGGVNRGIHHAIAAGAERIALFNNDAVADPGWLAALDGVLDARPEVGIATGLLLMGDGATIDSTGDFYSTWGLALPRDRGQPADRVPPSGEVLSGSGGASLYRSSLFADIGDFDESFFAYLEDVDLGLRAQLSGYRAYYCADAVAYHHQGTTSRRIPGFVVTQFFRNLPLLLVKDVPGPLLPPIAARFAIVYPMMVLSSFRRQEGRFAVRGALAAIGQLPRAARARRHIQRTRRVDAQDLASRLWSGLPPGMQLLRRPRAALAWFAGPLRRAEREARRRPAVVLAAGTAGGAGTTVALRAALSGLAAETAVAVVPRRWPRHPSPPAVELRPRRRVPALAREAVGLPRAGETYIGFADRLPLLGRAAPNQVMVAQNPHLYTTTSGWGPMRGAKLAVLARWARRSARRAEAVICTSTATRTALIAATGVSPPRVRVVPIPVPSPARFKTTHRLSIEQVLVVSDTYPYKHLDVAVDATVQLAERLGQPVELVLYGRDVDSAAATRLRAAMARAAARGTTVRRLGVVAHDEVLEAMADADLLLLTSASETQGLPLAEAMAVGLPVVCRGIDVFVEQGGDAVASVAVEATATDFAEAMISLADSATRNALATAARRRITTGDTWCLLAAHHGAGGNCGAPHPDGDEC